MARFRAAGSTGTRPSGVDHSAARGTADPVSGTKWAGPSRTARAGDHLRARAYATAATGPEYR